MNTFNPTNPADVAVRTQAVLKRCAQVTPTPYITEEIASSIVIALAILDDSEFKVAIESYFQ
ncbi:hypothetical protein [Pseudomonas sp.]|uniref:hypothetical protein n=1 Tax=Pseudomonas sp. TaxID=306 RepID=UPI002FC647A3